MVSTLMVYAKVSQIDNLRHSIVLAAEFIYTRTSQFETKAVGKSCKRNVVFMILSPRGMLYLCECFTQVALHSLA